ncbi:MAG: lysophospholipase [Deltaproteobacteria bacterium]|nr:lysophospholipase [Deltaproteobacteria bacterium]
MTENISIFTPRGWPALLLALALFLPGCMEQIIEGHQGEAAPPITGGEASGTPVTTKLCTTCTVPEFNPDGRRLALPNDLVLASLNEALVADGKNPIPGTAVNMPIRIPFDGPILYPYASGNSAALAAAAGFAQTLFILDITDPANPAPGPSVITSSVTGAGGTFKTIYQDSNNDLVLVPGMSTFGLSKRYAVVVTKYIQDAMGNPIDESYIFTMLKSTEPLIVNGAPTLASLDEESAASLEAGRQEMAPLLAGLAAGTPALPRDQVALIFTFTTETGEEVAPGVFVPSATAVGGLIAQTESDVSGAVTYVLNPDPTTVQWADGAFLTGASTTHNDDPASAYDIISSFPPELTGGISAVYQGSIPCISLLTRYPDTAAGEYYLDAKDQLGPKSPCPNMNGLAGRLEFFLSLPTGPAQGVVLFQHGLQADNPLTPTENELLEKGAQTFIATASAMAQAGYAVVAMDAWAHGSRAYPDAKDNTKYSEFVRIDDPSLYVGYMQQNRIDLFLMGKLLQAADNEIATMAGITGAPTVNFLSLSLGSILGINAASTGALTFNRSVFSVPGGDNTDIMMEGGFQSLVFLGLAAAKDLVIGTPEFNSTALGLELAVRHASFAGLVDAMATLDPLAALPDNMLMQQIIGDETVPNNNNELAARMLGLTTTNTDGATVTQEVRSRWILDPDNYNAMEVGAVAGHSFLLDWETQATYKGQTQAATYFALGSIIDPSLVPDLVP